MASYRTVNTLTETDAAYIAGIIDGEGTITLTREHSNENRRLVLSISSTEAPLLLYVKSAIGAGRITNKRTASSNHTPSFAYRLTNRQALDLIRQIQPFLRTYKARRAVFVLEHYERVTPRNGRYTPELKQAREHFENALLAILP